MEEIYNYIAMQLQAPENAMGQYNRIVEAIEGLNVFPERIKLMESKPDNGVTSIGCRSLFCFLCNKRYESYSDKGTL